MRYGALFFIMILLASSFPCMDRAFVVINVSNHQASYPINLSPMNNGMNPIDGVLKLVDRNKNKIYDALEANLTRDMNDEFDVVVILKSSDDQVKDWLEQRASKLKIFSQAIQGYSAILRGEDIIKLADFDSVLLIQPNIRHRGFMHRAGQLIGVRPYIWRNYGLLGSTNFTIALLDTGIDPTHPMLSPWGGNGNFSCKVVAWYDAVNGFPEPYDDNGHGTANAALAVGKLYDGVVIKGNKVSLKFMEYGFVVDGYSPDFKIYYYDYIYVPIPGDVNISLFWLDYSIQSEAVPEHHASIDEVIVFDPEDSEIGRFKASESPLNFTFNAQMIGSYRVEVLFNLTSVEDDPERIDGPGIIFWGFAYFPVKSDDEFPYFGGVAPEAKIVGVKVLDRYAYGNTTHILNGIEWVIEHKIDYKILEAIITFGSQYVDVAVEKAVMNLIKNGIITVIAAGNYGPYTNTIASPGRLDMGITVGASNSGIRSPLRVPNWSSRGPYGRISNTQIATGNTTKPDVIAPGGDFDEPSLICADTNHDDDVDVNIYILSTGKVIENRTSGISELVKNDFKLMRGTSVSASIAGGAIALLIQALTNDDWFKWNYTIDDVARVKQLLLLTSWEITGNATSIINRGIKDYFEGFGMIQVDAAIDAVKLSYELGTEAQDTLTTQTIGKHVWARKVHLEGNKTYIFRLTVSGGSDFDMYLWSGEHNSWGEPILLAKGISDKLGKDEFFIFKPVKSGIYYITIKAITGEGRFVLKAYEVTQGESSEIFLSPKEGSLLESMFFRVRVNVTVEHTYIIAVRLNIGGRNYTLLKTWESDDGRAAIFEGNVTTNIFIVKGILSIVTPIEVIKYKVTWYVIPYLTPMIISTIIVLSLLGAVKYQRYIKKKKLEKLKEVSEKAEKLAKEILEELKREGAY